MEFIRRWLGGSSEAEIKRLKKTVALIDAQESRFQNMPDQELRGITAAFRQRLGAGETLDDLLPEAFAAVREAMGRTLGIRHFAVQMIGGIVLHQGRIAEMKTGEGKTHTAVLAAYLNALPGEGVHIVTVNDYLARSQSELMGKIYKYLGLTVGLIEHDMENEERKAAYACDVVYATNNELGFDYLRDNMVIYRDDMVQRKLNFAIVDEVDSILIDEARTPLIISGRGDKSTEMYTRADRFVRRLVQDVDFVRDEKLRTINLTEEGTLKAERHFGVENLADIENTELNHHILQGLKANVMMKRDVDYVVQNGEVIIVDEFTGRLMTGRRYSDGLHQAIEAKEGVKVERESKTLATITFQNYFRMYHKLSGMTGTAKTEEDEFRGIYKLDVVQIPTNKPMIRKDMNDVVYRSKTGKFEAVAEEVVKRHATGQPVLIGTVSVETSELVSEMLSRRGVKHEVLNAKFHAKEAEIVAQAGKENQVTIATNMAGRGTDILLGGNPEFLARQAMRMQGYAEEMIEEATGHAEDAEEEVLKAREVYRGLYARFKTETDSAHDKVVDLGGLHIIGTERHEARRIDNQLRGRAGRQGDPGSSQFFISLEDDLMRLFGSDRFKPLMDKLGGDDELAMEYKILSKQIENAQKRVESRNFDIRKSVLQYDDVMNQQRETIYAQRRAVLEGENLQKSILDMLTTFVAGEAKQFIVSENDSDTWNLDGLSESLERVCLQPGDVKSVFDQLSFVTKEAFLARLTERAQELYTAREEELHQAGIDMREFERVALLGAVDERWMDHIDAMDQLRDGIGLRAYGHRDPIVEYKLEGYEMFDEMVRLIREDTLHTLMKAQVRRAPERKQVMEPTEAHLSGEGAQPAAPKKAAEKVGRNDPCPCGSGKKYKHCHGRAGA